MDNIIYSNLGKKNRYNSYLQNSDVVENDRRPLSRRNMAIKTFCEQLKELLEVEDIDELINDIFHIQHESASSDRDMVKSDNGTLYFFDIFFKELSPILLRAFIEGSKSKERGVDSDNKWIEAIRVALEEELYFWQENLFNS